MKSVIPFLSDLKQNNNREWFRANKKNYDQAKSEFESFINVLIAGIVKFDPSIGTMNAKECVFRIYRDVRFSKDKSPYKSNMGGFISRGGRKGGFAGYYFHLDPEQSFIAGGMYMPPSVILKKVRQEIMYNIEEFKGIIHKASFQKTFGQLEGEQLKRPPKDFPPDFPGIDLLKFKSYTVLHSFNPTSVSDADYNEYTLKVFREMLPLNKFLNKAIE
ncbi:MAG: DUF2461 domain-containing protein [Bacteroidales bacterium]|nr:DUF2461 domain-containing protein [Bacteroidales bacterium]